MPAQRISQTRENLLLLLLGVVGAVIFAGAFPRVQPAAQFDLRIDRWAAAEQARFHASETLPDLTRFTREETSLLRYTAQFAFYQYSGLTPDQVRALEAHRPPVTWRTFFIDPTTDEQMEIRLGPDGDIFACTRMLPDNLAPGTPAAVDIPLQEALALARRALTEQFGTDWAAYRLVDQQSDRSDQRSEHAFTWEHTASVGAGARRLLRATVAGEAVISWSRHLEFPRPFLAQYEPRSNWHSLFPFMQAIIAISVSLIALVVFALRFRAREVGLKKGLVAGTIAFGTLIYFSSNVQSVMLGPGDPTSHLTWAIKLMNIGLNAIFTSIGVFCVWVAGETLTRERWPAKLLAFDGLFAKRLFTPNIGRGVLRGFSLGLGVLGLWYGLAWLFVQLEGIWVVPSLIELQWLSALLPFGLPLLYGVLGAILATGYGPLFSLAWLRKQLRHIAPAVLVVLLLFDGFFNQFTTLMPFWIVPLVGIISGLLSYVFYLRYGLLTYFVNAFVVAALPMASTYLAQPAPFYWLAGTVSLVMMAGLLVFGYLARTRGTALDPAAVEPRYVRYITERERLKMELDIARRAQLRMLPREVPKTEGLDIAAFSEPALQVGGDYYDFFPLDDRRLGVAVGDVSGKGMPAALYMTMMKGFLQSTARPDAKPSEILAHLNRKFYQIAEPNVYVTLLYGILDLDTGTLTYARAGHNPLLVYRPAADATYILQPPGLGIGLEAGPLFDRAIRDETFRLQPGDMLLLYTDGLSEARNAAEQEFGSDRVVELLKASANGSAEGVLQEIRSHYNTFLGTHPPHDDITCVVIRVS